MAQSRVLTSLGELATVRDRFADEARRGPVPPVRALVPVIGASDPETIAALAATAQAALDELEALAVADRTERDAAAAGLAQWRRLTAAAQRCETLAAQLGRSRHRAEALAEAAVTDHARGHAAAVAATCGRLAAQASPMRRRSTAPRRRSRRGQTWPGCSPRSGRRRPPRRRGCAGGSPTRRRRRPRPCCATRGGSTAASPWRR